jgi:hypothetical protein
MKTTLLPQLTIIAVALFFCACKKNMTDVDQSMSTVEDIENERTAFTGIPVVPCRIERVRYSNNGGLNYDTVLFSYNSFNNPTKVIFKNNDTYLGSHFYFKYDVSKNVTGIRRLEDTTLYNTNSGTWEKLTYKGSKIIDTIFYAAAGWPASTPTSYSRYEVQTYKLDSLKRVIEWDYASFGTPRHIDYKYDNNGNLIRPDGAKYKLNVNNIRVTNKVWMFIDRDYSVNMPTEEGAEFTPTRLPKKLKPFGKFFMGIVYDGGNAWVSYSCY